jgi:predicted component of type VI protein secretion system
MRLTLEYAGVRAAHEIVLDQPFAVVGSLPNADIPLDGPEVGKRHAYLQVIDGRVFCVDVSDGLGVQWEDGVRQAGWLDEGQAVYIGPYRLRLIQGGAGPDAPGPAVADPLAPAAAAHPALTLEFFKDDRVQSRWNMNRVLALVGRLPICRVRIHDERVSRVHCALLATPGGVWLIDLLGVKGVKFNGSRVRFARVGDGDRVDLGGFQIRFRGGPQAPRAGLPVPVGPLAARPPAPLEMVPDQGGPLPMAVVQQLGQMQFQMFEQFQQALLTMFQMFSAMHNDQVSFLREELSRLQQVTQELNGLQKELQKSGQAPPGPAASPAPFAGAPPAYAPAPAPDLPPLPEPNGPPQGTPELHAWLCQRMEALQQERQGRWQKIMDFLTGKRAAEGLP